ALPARPCGVGHATRSRAISVALDAANLTPADVGWVHLSASGDRPRDLWERTLVDTALAPFNPASTALDLLIGRHSGTGALRVAAGAWTARSGLLPRVAGLAFANPPEGVSTTRVPAKPGPVPGPRAGGPTVG